MVTGDNNCFVREAFLQSDFRCRAHPFERIRVDALDVLDLDPLDEAPYVSRKQTLYPLHFAGPPDTAFNHLWKPRDESHGLGSKKGIQS